MKCYVRRRLTDVGVSAKLRFAKYSALSYYSLIQKFVYILIFPINSEVSITLQPIFKSTYKTMKRFFFLFAVIFMVTLMSCKQAEAPVVIPTSLFKAAVVKHPVQNYARFKTVFMASDSMTMANGFHTIGVARGIQDTNVVAVIAKLDDVARAKAFLTSPEIKSAMDSATVSGPPTIDFIDVLRNDDSEIPQMERISIKHHVKDFAAWLKVYDQEGKEARASYGMIDRALGRGVDDSNMVYLVFAITDMTKAMEHGQSPELKKLLEESGVDSEPEMFAYKFDMYKEK